MNFALDLFRADSQVIICQRNDKSIFSLNQVFKRKIKKKKNLSHFFKGIINLLIGGSAGVKNVA